MHLSLETNAEKHIFFFSVHRANLPHLSDIWPIQQKHKFCQGPNLFHEFLGSCIHELVTFYGY